MRNPSRLWIAVDIETYPDDTALPLLELPEPHKGLKDPEKIAADVEAKRAAQVERMSLDPYALVIVAIGWQTESMAAPEVRCFCGSPDEVAALDELGALIGRGANQRDLVGFNMWGFDYPVMLTRARLLDVDFPELDTRKYANRDITDLYQELTFHGAIGPGSLGRSLTTLAKRFGIPVDDEIAGDQIKALVDAGDWAAVEAHCRSDVALTVAMAQRLGVIAPAAVTTEARAF